MSDKLTPEQVAAYIAAGGNHCPFCKSEDIEGGRLEADSNEAWAVITCQACYREWHDVYTLTGVEEIK